MNKTRINNGDKSSNGDTDWIVKSASITLIGTILGGVMLFINEVLLARILGSYAYGHYAIAIVITRIAETLSLFGVGMAILHFLPIYKNDKRYDLVWGLVLSAAIVPLLLSLILIIVIKNSSNWFGVILFNDPDSISYVNILIVAIPFMCLSEIAAITTRAYGYSKYYVFIRNFIPPAIFLIILTFIYTNFLDKNYIMHGFVIAYVCSLFAGIIWLSKVLDFSKTEIKPRFRFKEIYLFSFPVLISSFMYLSILWTDILMLGVFSESNQVGIYRACMQIVVLFEIIVISFNAATSRQYSVLYQNNRLDDLKTTYSTANRWIAFIITPIFLIIVIKSRELLELMGSDFTAGWIALIILAFGQVIRAYLGSSGFLLVLCKYQKTEMLNSVVVAILNITLNALLIPEYGIAGAAIATSLSHLALNIMRIIEVKLILNVKTISFMHLKYLLITISTYLIFNFVYELFFNAIENNIIDILLSSLLIMIIYISVIILTGMMRTEFKVFYRILNKAE